MKRWNVLFVALVLVATMSITTMGVGGRTFTSFTNGPNLSGVYEGKFSGKVYVLEPFGTKPQKVKGTVTITATQNHANDRDALVMDFTPVDDAPFTSTFSQAAYSNLLINAGENGETVRLSVNKKVKSLKGLAMLFNSGSLMELKIKAKQQSDLFTLTVTDPGMISDSNPDNDPNEEDFTEGLVVSIGTTIPTDMVFDTWTSTPPGAVFTAPTSAFTQVTIPGNDVTVTPTFLPAP